MCSSAKNRAGLSALGDDDAERTSRSRRTYTLFQRRDIERNRGQVFEHHGVGRASLKPRECLDVTEAPLACVDRACGASLLRHERDQRVDDSSRRSRGNTKAGVPLLRTPATPEMAAALDAAHFRKCRPRPHSGQYPSDPARRERRRPAAAARVQEGHSHESHDRFERLFVRTIDPRPSP